MKAYSLNLTLAPVRSASYSLSQSYEDGGLLSGNYKIKKYIYKATHPLSSVMNGDESSQTHSSVLLAFKLGGV